jgi:hypothetical protein
MASTYEVVVGNIGTVHRGTNLRDARFHARSYVDQSKSGRGRAAEESVTVLRVTGSDVEIIDEYIGPQAEQD